MKHPATQALHAYWDRLRGDRLAPERRDIDPVEIRGVLADTFILDVGADMAGELPAPVVRLAGTRVAAFFGDDPIVGRPFLELWRMQDGEAVAELIATVLDDMTAVVAGVLAAPDGYPPLGLELLLLPLRSQGKTHSQLLGSLSPAAVPSWLGLLPSAPLQITTQRVLERQPCLARAEDLASPRSRSPSNRGSVRRGHLTLHFGGRIHEWTATSVR